MKLRCSHLHLLNFNIHAFRRSGGGHLKIIIINSISICICKISINFNLKTRELLRCIYTTLIFRLLYTHVNDREFAVERARCAKIDNRGCLFHDLLRYDLSVRVRVRNNIIWITIPWTIDHMASEILALRLAYLGGTWFWVAVLGGPRGRWRPGGWWSLSDGGGGMLLYRRRGRSTERIVLGRCLRRRPWRRRRLLVILMNWCWHCTTERSVLAGMRRRHTVRTSRNRGRLDWLLDAVVEES